MATHHHRSLDRIELQIQMRGNLNYRLKKEEALCKLNARLESFWQACDDDSSDDLEMVQIDHLLRTKEWNELVKQSTTCALPKTSDWTVTSIR